MYTALVEKGLDVFRGDWYWSSSQINTGVVWGQSFSNGAQNNDAGNSSYFGPAHKDKKRRVRAIRQF